ncbi:MAG TPA: tetratricopeptide repeat protein [Clostridiaceae bacterium]|nr:tetratricopeptide repeat protein [Clostridiaceae bacterium]
MEKINDRIEAAHQLYVDKHFEQALTEFNILGEEKKLSNKQKFQIALNKGIIKMNLNNYDEAQHDMESALLIGEKTEDLYRQARALHQLGILAKLRGDYDNATELFREELRKCSSLMPSYYADLSYNFYEQGDVKMLAGDFVDARMYFNHAIVFAETETNYHGVGLATKALGRLSLTINRYEDALCYFRKSYENFKLAEDQEGIESALNEITKLEESMHHME